MRRDSCYHQVSLATVALAALVPSTALAQNALTEERADPQDTKEQVGLQDIVVTARRTTETLQTVPLAVTALSGDFLEQQNVVVICPHRVDRLVC